MIKGLHHNAYRCRDSEQTRQFYEGFLGLPFDHSGSRFLTHRGRSAPLEWQRNLVPKVGV